MALTTDAIHFQKERFPSWGVLLQIKGRCIAAKSQKCNADFQH